MSSYELKLKISSSMLIAAIRTTRTRQAGYEGGGWLGGILF